MKISTQIVALLFAATTSLAVAEDAKEVPKAVQVVLAVSAKADAQADAELKVAQLKALAKKIEGRKAAIKAAESAIRTAAIKGDPALEALVATKSELQAQVKELESATKSDTATSHTLQEDVTAALTAHNSARAIALLQGTWNSRTSKAMTIRGTKDVRENNYNN